MNKLDIELGPSPVDGLRGYLKKKFPLMKSSIVEKNVNFTILLEEFTGEFYGLEEFLDDKNYILEGIKYSKTKTGDILITNEQEEKINIGKYNIGLKIFCKRQGDNLICKIYFVIAKKRNILKSEWVNDKIRDLMTRKNHA